MTSFLIDANPLLRYLITDIPAQASQTEALLKKAARHEIEAVLSPLVVAEVVFTLTKSYSWPKAKVCDVLLQFAASPHISIVHRDQLVTSINLFKQHSLSFIDCLLLADARHTHRRIFTFDRRLKSLSDPQ